MKTRHLSLVTSAPSVTIRSRESVPSPFGPVRAGLTTSQITQDQRLSELLRNMVAAMATAQDKYVNDQLVAGATAD